MRKSIALILSLAMLLSIVSVGGVMPAAAETAVTGGSVTAVTSAADIPTADNLIGGKSAFWGGTEAIIQSGSKAYLEGTPAALTDSKVQGLDVIADADTCAASALRVNASNGNWAPSNYNAWNAQVWISFDMGESKTVDTFLLAHSLLGDLATGTATGKLASKVEVRVTATREELLTADPVMTFSADDLGSMPTTMVMTLDEAVTGQYVGFYITPPGSNTDYFAVSDKKANYIYLSELGAYQAILPPSTMTVTGATLASVAGEADLPKSNNLLAGLVPTVGDTNKSLSDSTVLYSGSAAALTDGQVQGINRIDTTETVDAGQAALTTVNNAWIQSSNGWGAHVWLVYNLGQSTEINTIVIANSLIGNLADAAQSGRYVYQGEIYVADTRAHAVSADYQAVTFNSEGGHHSTPAIMRFDLNTVVTGQYVGIHFVLPEEAVFSETGAGDGSGNYKNKTARLSEIGVYNTAATVTGGTMTAVTEEADLPTSDNLLATKTPTWGTVDTVPSLDNGYLLEGNLASLTDGAIQGLDVTATEDTRDDSAARITAANGYWSGASVDGHLYVYLTYDLGESKTMDTVLVSHSMVGALADNTWSDYAYKLGVFISDKLTASSDKANACLTMADTAENFTVYGSGGVYTAPTVLFKLDEAQTGQYVTIMLEVDPTTMTKFDNTARNTQSYWAYISELGVYCESEDPHPFTSQGAQVRNPGANDKYALRFVFDVANTGIVYANEDPVTAGDYTGDLTNAYVTVEGESHKIKGMGAVVSIVDDYGIKLTKDDLLDGKIADVPAKNLYEVTGGVATFTAVVVDIPADHAGDTIHAVPYVVYETDEGDKVLYGEMRKRTVNKVLTSAGVA